MAKIWKISGKKHAVPTPMEKPAIEPLMPKAAFQIHRSRKNLSVLWKGKLYFGEWTEQSQTSASSGGGSESDLSSQFPGKIKKILVKEAESVNEGQKLLLMEAMKMEFTIKAPYTGVIEKILVQEGQQVTPGARFLNMTRKG